MAKEVSYIREHDLDLLRRSIPVRRDIVLLELLYESGSQVRDVVNVCVHDIDAGNRTIQFKNRNVPLSTFLLARIQELCQGKSPEAPLFSSRQSTSMTKKRVCQIIQKHSQTILGRTITPQVLRYTHIAHALNKGIPLERIQQHVGLADLRMKQIARGIEKHAE